VAGEREERKVRREAIALVVVIAIAFAAMAVMNVMRKPPATDSAEAGVTNAPAPIPTPSYSLWTPPAAATPPTTVQDGAKLRNNQRNAHVQPDRQQSPQVVVQPAKPTDNPAPAPNTPQQNDNPGRVDTSRPTPSPTRSTSASQSPTPTPTPTPVASNTPSLQVTFQATPTSTPEACPAVFGLTLNVAVAGGDAASAKALWVDLGTGVTGEAPLTHSGSGFTGVVSGLPTRTTVLLTVSVTDMSGEVLTAPQQDVTHACP
jgi:hypothetical protein